MNVAYAHLTPEPSSRRWRAYFAGHVIADTDRAVILREAGAPPRVCFPMEDVSMEYIHPSDREAAAGEARPYTLLMDGQFAEQGAWAWTEAAGPAAALAGRLVFVSDTVEVYWVDDAEVNPRHRTVAEEAEPRSFAASPDVDDVVMHTDSGGGAAQRERWNPTVGEGPDADDPGLV